MEKVNRQQLMLTPSFEDFHLQDDLSPLQEILRHSIPLCVIFFKTPLNQRFKGGLRHISSLLCAHEGCSSTVP